MKVYGLKKKSNRVEENPESLHAARDNIREAIELFLEDADPGEVGQRMCLLCT